MRHSVAGRALTIPCTTAPFPWLDHLQHLTIAIPSYSSLFLTIPTPPKKTIPNQWPFCGQSSPGFQIKPVVEVKFYFFHMSFGIGQKRRRKKWTRGPTHKCLVWFVQFVPSPKLFSTSPFCTCPRWICYIGKCALMLFIWKYSSPHFISSKYTGAVDLCDPPPSSYKERLVRECWLGFPSDSSHVWVVLVSKVGPIITPRVFYIYSNHQHNSSKDRQFKLIFCPQNNSIWDQINQLW